MKTKLVSKLFILSILMSALLGCSKSKNSVDDEVVEIIDNSILTGDVNAPDFWDGDNLVWSDEFNGSSLSLENWAPQRFLGGVGNTELQNYNGIDNLEVSNGTLKIKVDKIGEGQNTGDYNSGRLNSKFIFTYGRVEMRAKLPAQLGNGLWAKLWLLGSNFEQVGFPNSGVIDIMKYVSHIPDEVLSEAITADNLAGNAPPGTSGPIALESAESQFHNYGVLWTDEYLKFYIDSIDNVTFTYQRPPNANDKNWPFTKSFYFIMNVAVGGEFGGVEGVDDTIFPTQMEIDYVRVYHGKK
ncbi:glycoside hydrolase family 16 protein [Maribacter algarum]|uniref:Glycoside hydrolase family 16 protein n=1 Tax=Maribacter algarum (ex Zhang et al. 2020) TaxID=2578118 RepID=A0A5S3PTH3_9FLAO|nr:glycoside hydrolase family 16 protein [Maribacter algarum]TMM58208.1 glycoside hydrolase family 16 protein [Maribacter algarum]